MRDPKILSRSFSSSASRRPMPNWARASRGGSGVAICSSESARSTGNWERPSSQTFNKSVAVAAYCMWRSRRVGEGCLGRLGHFDVALPPFVFQFDVLNKHGVGVGVQVRERLKFRNPTPEDLVSNHQLAGFVIDFEEDIFAKVFERNFRAKTGSKVPNLVSPSLE